ncbi:MAG: amidohydrolase family protein [Cyanobacteria bacterium P01_D01_bin.44]
MTPPPTIQTLKVGQLLSCPGELPATGPTSITVKNGLIEAITPIDAALTEEQHGQLAMPALANAHDHGRGLDAFGYGALDQALELWLPALKLKPKLSMYALTALELARVARSGVGAAVHCHNTAGGDLLSETQAVCQAARDVGVRLALAVPMRDHNALVYGDPQRLLALLPAADRERVRATWDPPTLTPQAQIERVHAIADECEGGLVQVQYCPWGPQWCSNELLEAIAAASAETGRRIHTHLFETRYQREWADAQYPQGLLQYLDDIGLLSPRLTVAHGVWLSSDDLALLAERGVILSVNTSSNLRLRSGIAAYRAMRDAGVAVAFGLDGMSLNNNADAFEELRLNYNIHAKPGVHSEITPAEMFAAHRHGVTAVTNQPGGLLRPGEPADFTLLNYAAMTQDVIPDACSVAEVVLARGSHQYVEGLWVAGQPVVEKGQVLGVDEAAIKAEVQGILKSQAQHVYSLQPLVNSYQQALQQFYAEGLHQVKE